MYRCRPGLTVHKLGLSDELAFRLRLAMNPKPVVSVFYNLRENPKAFRQRMQLGLFTRKPAVREAPRGGISLVSGSTQLSLGTCISRLTIRALDQ